MDHSEIESESVLQKHSSRYFQKPDAQPHSRRAWHQFLSFLSFCGAVILSLVTLYQKNIERYCHEDPAAIREQIRRTLLHEVAHHFGIDHEEMPIRVR